MVTSGSYIESLEGGVHTVQKANLQRYIITSKPFWRNFLCHRCDRFDDTFKHKRTPPKALYHHIEIMKLRKLCKETKTTIH